LTARKSQPKKPKQKRTPTSIDDPVDAWAQAVLDGEIIAGPHVRNACRRHQQDRASKRGLTWDLEAALKAIGFFRDRLRLAQGKFEGKPFLLEPSQQFIIGSMFGWKTRDGFRRFRRAYIEQGKGQGKSPLAAGIGMYCLVADKEAQAEVYAGASMKSQAMVIFRAAVMMWRQSPLLKERLTPSGGNPIWALTDMVRGGFFRSISTEEAHSGPMPSCALLDELHEHRDGNMVEMMERGFKSRRQPLLIMITNSGSDRESVCWQEHLHAVRVAAGTMTPDEDATYVGEVIDDTAFSFVCGLDKDDDPLEDESCWVKANPMLGVTQPVAEVRRAVAQAKAIPGKLNNVLRLHFCVWTDSDEAWMGRAALEAVLADFDPIEHAGKKAHAGADLSGSQDLTAVAFVVETGVREVTRIDKDGEHVLKLPTYDAWVEAWTPKDTLAERALRDQAPYDVWARDGWLNAVDGRNIRLDFVAARIAEANTEYQIALLAYDRYAYRKLEEELDAQGVTIPQAEHPQGGIRRAKPTPEQLEAAKMSGEEPPQGLWMPGSVVALETLILEKRIRLRRSPVLISAMMSAAVEHDPFDNRWFSKRKAVNRIDALVALTMAVGAATAAPSDSGSVSRGILLI
jgi:phage terminase large subunit-like protein